MCCQHCYIAEAWMCNNFARIGPTYLGIIKSLLSVRRSTCNNLCLIEANMPSLAAPIKHRRASYLQKKKEDEPLKIALELVRVCNTKSYRIICNVLDEQISNILQTDYDSIKSQIQKCAATSSKIATYQNEPNHQPHTPVKE